MQLHSSSPSPLRLGFLDYLALPEPQLDSIESPLKCLLFSVLSAPFGHDRDRNTMTRKYDME